MPSRTLTVLTYMAETSSAIVGKWLYLVVTVI